MTIEYAKACVETCCGEFNVSTHYDCYAGIQDREANVLRTLVCALPSIPSYIESACYGSLAVLSIALAAGLALF